MSFCVLCSRGAERVQHPGHQGLSRGGGVPGHAPCGAGQSGASGHEGRGQAAVLRRLHVPVQEQRPGHVYVKTWKYDAKIRAPEVYAIS